MHGHLRIVAVSVHDPDTLDYWGGVVLTALDPPLNLNEMPRSPIRDRLTELRRAVRDAG